MCENLIKIGRVLNAHGIKGELKLGLISENPEWLPQVRQIYIAFDLKTELQQKAPMLYVLEQKRWAHKFALCKLKGLANRTQAEKLKGLDVFVDRSFFTSHKEEEPYLLELKGFDVKMKNELVGCIFAFAKTQAHSIIVIRNHDGFFEIPWVETFIEKIDKQNQTVFMNFPQELLSTDFDVSKDYL